MQIRSGAGIPAAEVTVDAQLVRRLLQARHPDLADLEPLRDDQARVLANCLAALHQPATDAPRNPVRGVPLAARAASVEARMRRLPAELLPPEIIMLWRVAQRAGRARNKCWLHGDLHPLNLLVTEGRLTGIIDWGDVTGGDPATDLACIWMLFEKPEVRARARQIYDDAHLRTADPALWQRAAGWALLFAVLFLETGWPRHPRQAAVGARTLVALRQDAALLCVDAD